MARIKTNEDIPAPPGGSRSMRRSASFPMPFGQGKNPSYLKFIENDYNFVKNDKRAKYAKNVKSPSRAQPKGTPPAPSPRTGPGSGSGGQSARYNRLTGGLLKHGR